MTRCFRVVDLRVSIFIFSLSIPVPVIDASHIWRLRETALLALNMIISCYWPLSLFAIASASIGGVQYTDGHASGRLWACAHDGRPLSDSRMQSCGAPPIQTSHHAPIHSNPNSHSEVYSHKDLNDKLLIPTLTIMIIGIQSCGSLIVMPLLCFIAPHSPRRSIKSKIFIFTRPARAHPRALLALPRAMPLINRSRLAPYSNLPSSKSL